MGKSKTKNAPSSKQHFRVEGNRKMVEATMCGEVPSAMYAKVMSRLGDGRMRIYYEYNKHGCEGIGKIRGLLQRKGRVPIQTNDVVVVTPREFESGKDAHKHFDIIGVLAPKQVGELTKDNLIPDYFINDISSNEFTKKEMKDGFEFDYSDHIDIDNI